MADRLKQEGALASARMAAHQDGGTFHKPAAQNAVKLLHAGADARLFGKADVVKAFYL